MNVKSRAHRILRRLHPYQAIESHDNSDSLLPHLPPDEFWIGIYRNLPGSIESAVAFSSEQLHVNEGDGWTSVKYREILDSQISQDKSSANEILVRTSDYNLPVPIWGVDGKTRDVFEVLRFLNRVREDLNENYTGLAQVGS